MNILVFGLGALGTVYACLLKKAGHWVAALSRGAAAEIREQGVKVTGIWGDHDARLDVVASSVEELRGEEFDLVLVTVKSFATGDAARDIAGLGTSGAYVVLLQNGYGNYQSAAGHLPRERLVLGRVIFGAETVSPGNTRVTVIADDVVLGAPEGLVAETDLARLAELFNRAGIPTRASDEVMKYVWGKIIYNSALNPLGALLNVEYGKLAEIEQTRELMDEIIDEIFNLLQAMGQDTFWPGAGAYRQDFYGRMVPVTASHHSSMLQDLARGRRTEIDALNGAVVALGRQHGVPTPVNEVITRLVKAREQLSVL